MRWSLFANVVNQMTQAHFPFDPCYTISLSANLFQFKIDYNCLMSGNCLVFVFLKKSSIWGVWRAYLRNSIMLGERINDDFLAKTINMRKVWKENKRGILEKQLWGEHQAFQMLFQEGDWFKSKNLKWLWEEVSRKWTISSVLCSWQSNIEYTRLVSQTTEAKKTRHLVWCGRAWELGNHTVLLFV